MNKKVYLQLVSIERTKPYSRYTKEFILREGEKIIDVAWSPEDVSITLQIEAE